MPIPSSFRPAVLSDLTSIGGADDAKVLHRAGLPESITGQKTFATPFALDLPPLSRVFGCQPDETWTAGSNTTLAVDTTNYQVGDRGLALTAADGATGSATCDLPIATAVGGTLVFRVHCPDVSKFSTITFDLYETPASDSPYRYNINYPYSYGLQNGWNTIVLRRDQFAAVGSPTAWGTAANPKFSVGRVRVFLTANAGAPATITLGDCLAYQAPRAAVVLGFDGPYTSTYGTAFQDMKARGYRGVLWCVTNMIGGGSGVGTAWTAAQLKEAHDAGWDTASHTDAAATYTSSTPATTIAANIMTAQKRLLALGCVRGHQFGSWLGNTGSGAGWCGRSVASRYWWWCRGSTYDPRYNGIASTLITTVGYSSWVPWDPYNIPYYAMYTASQTDPTDVIAKLDQAIIDRHVVPLYVHRILPEAQLTGLDVSTTYWSTLLAAIDARVAAGTLEVITMSDWYARVCGRGYTYFDQSGDLKLVTGAGTARRAI